MTLSNHQFLYAKPSFFLKAGLDLLYQNAYSDLILPSRAMMIWIRHKLQGPLPRMASLEDVWGGAKDSFSLRLPLTVARGAGQMLHFLQANGYAATPLESLFPLAISLFKAWEALNSCQSHWHKLENISLERLTPHGEKVLELLKKSRQFKCPPGFCARDEAQEESLTLMARAWQVRPPRNVMLLGIDPRLHRDLIKEAIKLPKSSFLFVEHPALQETLSQIVKDPPLQEVKEIHAQGRSYVLEKSLSLKEGASLEATPPTFTSSFQDPRPLMCKSLIRQARAVALLVREALQDPSHTVAILSASHDLKKYLREELKRWDIFLPSREGTLGESLLLLILQGSLEKWPLRKVLKLARHPYIFKTYPASLSLASAVEKRHAAFKTAALPLWAQKILYQVKNAASPLIEGAEAMLSLSEWVKRHAAVAQNFIPFSSWEGKLEELKAWEESSSPPLSIHEYVALFPLLLKAEENSWEDHSQVIFCKPHEAAFFSPVRCILTSLVQEDPFPWIPPAIKEVLPLGKTFPMEAPEGIELKVVLWRGGPEEGFSGEEDASQPACAAHWSYKLDQAPLPDQGLSLDLKRLLPPLNRLSLSDLQLWRTDDEKFYQRCILGVKPFHLSSSQSWGTAIHALMDLFIQRCPSLQNFSQEKMLTELQGLAEFFFPHLDFIKKHFLHELLKSIALCEWEKRQKYRYRTLTEIDKRLTFLFRQEGCPSDLKIALTARADRIDYLEDGTFHMIDYKTGALPSFVDIERMKAIQLPVEALMTEGDSDFGREWKLLPLDKPFHVLWKLESLTEGVQASQLSWWHLSLSKGCHIKAYPRPLAPLLCAYKKSLPFWMYALATGGAAPRSLRAAS